MQNFNILNPFMVEMRPSWSQYQNVFLVRNWTYCKFKHWATLPNKFKSQDVECNSPLDSFFIFKLKFFRNHLLINYNYACEKLISVPLGQLKLYIEKIIE
ncbi:unnamed protein product [Blepharisma stoltei]|uniref:Uncharacterized protein n=1 Tax=Blepharisma stoltei TaxID=1481888 RepID=A0AAU9JE76_9CILI|nr:unnamed protein product [Blepharisma stoltei]